MRLSPEKIQDLKESDGWKAVESYIKDRIVYLHEQMEKELESDELRRLQGAVRELRRLQRPEEILK